MEITGKVVYQELEGGFWGIQGDDGQNYRPVEPLPEAARAPGRRIRAVAEPADAFSVFMWGRSVRLRSVELLE